MSATPTTFNSRSGRPSGVFLFSRRYFSEVVCTQHQRCTEGVVPWVCCTRCLYQL